MDELRDPLIYIPKYFKILSKPDPRTGLAELIPMELWPFQRHYIENRTQWDVILTNRQIGKSSGILAPNAHAFFTQPYERQTIITHDDETSEYLLQTVHRFYNNLPLDMRPSKGFSAGHRITLDKLDSYMYIDSAKSDAIGIGHSLTRAHLSEVAKWPARRENQLFADISQTVGAGGYITMESTPKGRGGLFYRIYQAAQKGELKYKAFFYPWWWDVTAVRDPKDIIKHTSEEQGLIDKFKLTPPQIAFRREKLAELKELFYQEYPENDVDCWLSSEVSVFDATTIRYYMQLAYPGNVMGDLTIWKDVIGGEKYVIGVDSAGGLEKGDYSVAAVLRVRTNEYVARIRGKIAPDLFAQEVIRLGQRYNLAEVGVERSMHGYTVLHILIQAGYPNIYFHQDYDALLGNVLGQPGWVTSGKTKSVMVDTLKSGMRSRDIMIWSENLCNEASSYIIEGQAYKKSPGEYDDELDALMIALQLREGTPITLVKRHMPGSYIRL